MCNQILGEKKSQIIFLLRYPFKNTVIAQNLKKNIFRGKCENLGQNGKILPYYRIALKLIWILSIEQGRYGEGVLGSGH